MTVPVPGLTRVDHIGITVPDLAEASRFLIDVLGALTDPDRNKPNVREGKWIQYVDTATNTFAPSVHGVGAAYPPPGPLRKSFRSHNPGFTCVSHNRFPSAVEYAVT